MQEVINNNKRLILDIVLFQLGFVSNLVALAVFLFSPKLVNIGTRNIYIFMLIVDNLFLFVTFIDRSAFHSEFDLITFSSLICKMYPYLNRIFSTLSPMLLVYISVERYVSLQDLTKRFVLRNYKNQLLYLCVIILFNLVYYSPCLFFLELELELFDEVEKNETEYVFKCIIQNEKLKKWLPLMDLFNRVIVPCSLMVIASIMLISSIRRSRIRVLRDYTSYENRVLFKIKDIKLAITSISMNVLYMVLTLPLPICLLFGDDFSEVTINITFHLFFMSYSLNLFIVYVSNSLFRNEFMIFFNIRRRTIPAEDAFI